MAKTDGYRRQHDMLQMLMKGFWDDLNRVPEIDQPKIRRELTALAVKIRNHLILEDKSLYPRLLDHEDEEVRQLAQKFVDQMGSVADDFAAYLDKWSLPENISEEAAAFRADTRTILNRLEARIEQENEELYPLADKLL